MGGRMSYGEIMLLLLALLAVMALLVGSGRW